MARIFTTSAKSGKIALFAYGRHCFDGGPSPERQANMEKRLSEFLLDVHDASKKLPAEEFQKSTLAKLRGHVDFDFAIWGGGDGLQRNLHTATVLDQTDTLFNTWEPVKQEDRFADLVIGNTGRTWSLNQIPQVHNTRAFNEHWRLYHAQQMISTMQTDPQTGLYVFVTLARDQSHHPFTPEEMQFKNLITHHLFLAARHNDQHHLSGFRAPVALLDKRGLLHSALPDFRALTVSEWGRGARRRLPLAATRALWQLKEYQGQIIRLEAEAAGHRLVVSAQPRIVSQLSERELEVGWAYASGKSYKDVARALGISPATVRTHLTHIYRKLDVKDKGALALWLKEYD